MTNVRLDVWAPAGTIFRVKLVDFARTACTTCRSINRNSRSTRNPTPHVPPVVGPGHPSDRFTLTSRAHLAEIVISSSDARTVFVDNVLFHR